LPSWAATAPENHTAAHSGRSGIAQQRTRVPRQGLRIGYLPQEATLEGDRTLWQEMMAAFESLQEMEVRLRLLETEMADPAELRRLWRPMPHSTSGRVAGGYSTRTEFKHVLLGLGFPARDHDMPLAYLSGGQKTRACLARLLLESPDVLLLE